ncbi:arsenic transporter ATPase [Reticulibacter mediterranei]|uniref:Arsenic transporter ATPase n=1 Tax=Reticulibacter mediterranei TaxID=2778369 RepID=A0A8J3IFH3_9CHLR|nr:ArsA family ATPase [Reticulibacter mediterranei]GHO93521.1 arsenic transporter ATPase [Reticulibacter mediterranei]
MSLNGLLDTSLQFILFGGKGGVGKTTMAAATAVELAKTHKVLIFTTDPAPSLGDSFGQAIGSDPTTIAGMPNLYAMEIDARKVLKEFKEEYGGEILDILQQGTYLADEETEELFQLDVPGLDEVMSLKKVIDFMQNSDYQIYLVDTAPTGHTLRLLTLPELLDQWIKFLATLRWKYHTVVRHFAREERIEKADEFLLEMKRTVKKVQALLQNAEKTEFVVVTIAEKMAVSETGDLLRGLERMHISSRHIIVNNVFPREEADFARQRRAFQERYVQAIKQEFRPRSITEVILQPTEIQGIDKLQTLGMQLFTESKEEV